MYFSVVAVVLSLGGSVPYVYGIIRGSVRPERMTWFIWSVVLMLSLLGYRASGAGVSAWFVASEFASNTLVFGLSLWRGRGGLSHFDLLCLSIALAALGLWQVTDRPLLMLVGSVVADIVALTPTLVKSLRDPRSENAAWYACSAAAAVCGLLVVGRWDWLVLFYPAYLFVANLVTALTVWVGQYHVREAVA